MSNGWIFETPVFNYTRDFPYLWEEMRIPVSYKDDRVKVEEILLAVAGRHSIRVSELSQEALEKMRERYYVRDAEFEPNDDWLRDRVDGCLFAALRDKRL